MWMMNNAINTPMNSFSNSTNNSTFENVTSTKAKRGLQDYSNKTSPIQFGFNFYFNNVKSSPFTPMNSPKNQYLNKNNNIKSKIPINFIFKTTLEKSGYKLHPEQSIINTEYFNEYSYNNNNLNIGYNDDINYLNIPINGNYPLDNSSIINNIYPTITKVTNVKILSDNNNDNNNSNYLNDKNNLNNLLKIKKESINNALTDTVIEDSKNKEITNTESNKIIEKKEVKENLLNKKTKIVFECSESKINNGLLISKNFIKKKRFRKNNEQIALLSKFYNENKNWSKKEIKEMSKNIGLKENKIYKWLWDQKNKEYNKSTKFIINKNNNGIQK